MVFNALDLQNELSDPPFFWPFWQTLILKMCLSGTILGANALKNLVMSKYGLLALSQIQWSDFAVMQCNSAIAFWTHCLICLGDQLLVDSKITGSNQTAVLVSPVYNRSHYGHSKCLRFRYMLNGPGEKTLTVYQQVGNRRKTPIWVSQRETGSNWIDAQAPLSSVMKFQVKINLRLLIKDWTVWISQ